MNPLSKISSLFVTLLLLFSSTAQAEEYEYITVVFESLPKTQSIQEDVIRVCGVPIGYSTKLSGGVIDGLDPRLSDKLAVGIHLGKGYERFAKQDTLWSINPGNQIVLLKPGKQEITGIPVMKTVPAMEKTEQEKLCKALFLTKDLQAITEMEKASIAFAQAFEGGTNSTLQTFLEKNSSFEITTTHSLMEGKPKRQRLQGSEALLMWIQKVNASQDGAKLPNPVGKTLYSCTANSCQFGKVPILHNNLYLTEIFAKRLGEKTTLSKVDLYDGD